MHTGNFPTNLSPPVTLKMGSRSPKSNQYFCRCASLVKIYSFLQEIECGQAIFQQSKDPFPLLCIMDWEQWSTLYGAMVSSKYPACPI